MRFKLIGCEVLFRELCAAAARAPHQIDTEVLSRGLHERSPAQLVERLQQAVDAADAHSYDAVLLGYGLCGGYVAGLAARSAPVVLTRVQDCIGIFLPVPDNHPDFSRKNPGASLTSTGWVRQTRNDPGEHSAPGSGRAHNPSHAELVAKYGEENAGFLEAGTQRYDLRYTQLTFIETGVQPPERFERCTIEEAARRGWRFEKDQGEVSLLEGLVNGDWDPRRYLVVEPGHHIVRRPDDGTLTSQPVQG